MTRVADFRLTKRSDRPSRFITIDTCHLPPLAVRTPQSSRVSAFPARSSNAGDRIYRLPEASGYEETVIRVVQGERWSVARLRRLSRGGGLEDEWFPERSRP